MPLSKIRANAPEKSEDLDFKPTGDLVAFVTFTQRKEGTKYVIAGSIDAPDKTMAIIYAKEHYGQDQECVSLWLFPKKAIAGTHADHPTSNEEGPVRGFTIFSQKQSGDLHIEAGSVEACHSEEALAKAKTQLENAANLHSIWVVDAEYISSTEEGEMIWRNTDQTYRLARGYSKAVRTKWEAIRAAREVDEYQAEDLKESF
ncbi:MAG: hypothetical protein O7G85_12155 [Planctomycetota bacterium]|nr:hypothetical protein [Planctomycetota bacterium]